MRDSGRCGVAGLRVRRALSAASLLTVGVSQSPSARRPISAITAIAAAIAHQPETIDTRAAAG